MWNWSRAAFEAFAAPVPSTESNLPRVPICSSSFPSGPYFWMAPSPLPATQTLSFLIDETAVDRAGNGVWSPHDPTTLPSGSNLMIEGAEIDVSFSSSVMLRRLTT